MKIAGLVIVFFLFGIISSASAQSPTLCQITEVEKLEPRFPPFDRNIETRAVFWSFQNDQIPVLELANPSDKPLTISMARYLTKNDNSLDSSSGTVSEVVLQAFQRIDFVYRPPFQPGSDLRDSGVTVFQFPKERAFYAAIVHYRLPLVGQTRFRGMSGTLADSARVGPRVSIYSDTNGSSEPSSEAERPRNYLYGVNPNTFPMTLASELLRVLRNSTGQLSLSTLRPVSMYTRQPIDTMKSTSADASLFYGEGEPTAQSLGLWSTRSHNYRGEPLGADGPYVAVAQRIFDQETNGRGSYSMSANTVQMSCSAQYLPVEFFANQDQLQGENVLEIANVDEKEIVLKVTLLKNDGTSLGSISSTLARYESLKYLVPNSSERSSGIAIVETVFGGAFTVQSSFYYFSQNDDQSRRFSAAETIVGQELVSGEYFVPYNTFLKQSNWLRLFNPNTFPAEVSVEGFDIGGNSLGRNLSLSILPKTGYDLDFTSTVGIGAPVDSYGMLRIQISNGAPIVGTMFRVKPDPENPYEVDGLTLFELSR